MPFSLYHHPRLYEWAMRLAYGGEYAGRYAAVAAVMGQAADVLEVCCGDLVLYDRLRARGCIASYRGLDLSPAMVARGRRRGVDVRQCDVRATTEFPAATVVVMQASLYQFHDVAGDVLRRLWRAARCMLVVTEPVSNFSQSTSGLLRRLALVLSRPTDGRDCVFRYTDDTLRAVYEAAGIPLSSVSHTPTGKEMIIVSRKPGVAAS